MAYPKTIWTNDTVPAINANNLNKVENELELLDNAAEIGAINILPFTEETKYPVNLTVVAANGVYTISGTNTAKGYHDIYSNQSALLDGVQQGKYIYAGVTNNKSVKLDIVFYSGNGSSVITVSENTFEKIMVPNNAVGMKVRLNIPPDSYSNTVVKAYTSLIMPNQVILDYFDAINQDIANLGTEISAINNKMPTAGDKQYLNPETVSVIQARVVTSTGKLSESYDYRSLVIPASIIGNSQYRAKYVGSSATFNEFRLATFNSVNIGDECVDYTNLYAAGRSKVDTTATAQYFVISMWINSGDLNEIINNIVVCKSTEYPDEYYPYYVSVDEAIHNAVGVISSPDCVEVGFSTDYYQYDDVNRAVSENVGKIVKINFGTYETEVTGLDSDKKLLGEDREFCILEKHGGSYDNPPIEISGGVIKNLTVNMINNTQAVQYGYCVHSDNSSTANKKLIISNCKFDNDLYRVIGMGVRGGEEVIFENCEFVGHASDKGQSIYIHNSDGAKGTVRFRNCYFKAKKECLCLQGWSSACNIDWEFIDCTCVSEDYGVGIETVWTDYASGSTHDTSRMHEFSGVFALLSTSHGNNISVLNYGG